MQLVFQGMANIGSCKSESKIAVRVHTKINKSIQSVTLESNPLKELEIKTKTKVV